MRDINKIANLYLELFRELGVYDEITDPHISAIAMADVDLEYTSGYGEPDIKKNFPLAFDAPEGISLEQIVEIKNVQFFSRCEHHASPMWGLVHYFYIPNKKIIGLSKVARTVDWYGKRYQLQEQFTKQISDYLWGVLEPAASVVCVEGVHMCTVMRGAKSPRTTTQTRVQRVDEALYKSLKQEGALYHLIKDLLNHNVTGTTGRVSFL
ncbi:hypothetical protein D4R42_04755 [bacterium]|nr:MAG: hypothetical protein D4R42_04755 [bacterium]